MPIVIAIHIPMNGVPGNSQKASIVPAKANKPALLNIKPKSNGIHTSQPTIS